MPQASETGISLSHELLKSRSGLTSVGTTGPPIIFSYSFVDDEPSGGPDLYVCVIGFSAADLACGFASCGVTVDAVVEFGSHDSDVEAPTTVTSEVAEEGGEMNPPPVHPWTENTKLALQPKILASPQGW